MQTYTYKRNNTTQVMHYQRKKVISDEMVLEMQDMLKQGHKKKNICEKFNITAPTLNKYLSKEIKLSENNLVVTSNKEEIQMCDSQLLPYSHFLVRSIDRINYESTTPSKFSINLAKVLKGSKAQLIFTQIPNTYYNVNSSNNAINVDSTVYLLTPGSYTLNDLMSALSTLISKTVTFSTISNRITISDGVVFTMDLTIQNNMSKIIGFNGTYAGSMSYEGTFVPKLYENSIFIGTNFTRHIQTTSNLKNVSFVIPHNVNRGEIIQFYSATQFTLQPKVQDQTLGYIEIEVFDENGRLLDNLADWSMMLQIV